MMLAVVLVNMSLLLRVACTAHEKQSLCHLVVCSYIITESVVLTPRCVLCAIDEL
jgi:hypothetical protein